MTSTSRIARSAAWAALTGFVVLASGGCPELLPIVTDDYDAGFDVGFAQDDEYWNGYDDGAAMEGSEPIYYEGGSIPYVEYPLYDQGYWDGVWYAYNDGYFVDYDYAFTIGFSEGYDAAYFEGYLEFLGLDVHFEYDNGGWGDGYNDGFSEGRVFGANDYEQWLTFDWLDALLDYRSGTDLYFEEVDVGTGDYGPVYLYEYGWDPLAAKAATTPRAPRATTPSIRSSAVKAWDPEAIWYRPFIPEAADALNFCPAESARSPRPLTLSTTWLERVTTYLDATESTAKAGPTTPRNRAVAD